jgi:hypothetical protein
MSTELKSSTESLFLTRFYGGEVHRMCLQITEETSGLHVRVNRKQARSLAADLLAFANGAEQETT